MQDYHDLRVWRKAHAFAITVRKVSRTFPKWGYARFKAQLVNAAESIPGNIVEGCGAATAKEFARFLDVSIKSSSETEYWLLLARDNGILNQEAWRSLTDEVTDIRRMLYGLRGKVLAVDVSQAAKA